MSGQTLNFPTSLPGAGEPTVRPGEGPAVGAERAGAGALPPASIPATPLLTFTVRGEPIPQGSARGFKRGQKIIITSDNPRLRPWRVAVATACQDAMVAAGISEPIEGPVVVGLLFTVPKPTSAPKRRRTWPAKRPDVDKLERSCLDSLTDAGLWFDDGQVVGLLAWKDYPGAWLSSPGVVVSVYGVAS